MTDYISREAAIADIAMMAEDRRIPVSSYGGEVVGELISILRRIPAADAREVVLCRDCDMYECHEYDGGLKYVCRLFKRQMQETDFCSRGEKRKERT